MRILIGLIATVFALSPLLADAKGKSSGSRPSYGGGKHTSSHGGHYQGGKGSSHKGGDYRNTRSGDRYGKHR
ncbi:MAG TPA: hypothetical protein VHL79_00335 [Ramlibacter sp.]|jgi:hypothetical protein|nr:hypothetical protein [Ramlibacter sp.]